MYVNPYFVNNYLTYMNRYISLILIAFLPCVLQAQTFNCENDQYLLPQFTVNETPGILFGNNTGVNGQSEDLLLDIYEPSGDTSAVRPVILWGFGGSFVGGSRGQVGFLCEDYAALGYVAIAYDYRIGFFIPSSISTALAVLRGAHDTRGAVRWLYKSAQEGNPYRIDTNRIFLAGVSAGAVSAIHAAYLFEGDSVFDYFNPQTWNSLGGFSGLSGNDGYSEKVHGVVNYSGAVGLNEWIDGNEVPMISFHDVGDNIVPYDRREVNVFGIPTGLIASGSEVMARRLDTLGLRNCLQSYNSNSHVSYLYDSEPVERSARFLKAVMCNRYYDCEADSIGGELPPPVSTSISSVSDHFVIDINQGVLSLNNESIERIEIYDLLGQRLASCQGNSLPLPSYNGLMYVRLFNGVQWASFGLNARTQ